MRFQKTTEIEAFQYLPGKPLPPGVRTRDHGPPFISPRELVYTDLKGGEWIQQLNDKHARIILLPEWQRIDFNITVNGTPWKVPLDRVPFELVASMSGISHASAIYVIGCKKYVPGDEVDIFQDACLVVDR